MLKKIGSIMDTVGNYASPILGYMNVIISNSFCFFSDKLL